MIKFTNNFKVTNQSAPLIDVLRYVNLLNCYYKWFDLNRKAHAHFKAGDLRAAYNLIYQMWMHPFIVPTLLLVECYKARQLVLPTWNSKRPLYVQQLVKKSGGTRTILIPDLTTRVCMGVVNVLCQSACASWSPNTVGFRPGHGTHLAINLLAERCSNLLNSQGYVYILSFDIKQAFNSVNMNHLFHTLELGHLPHDIKALIWKWHHLHVSSANDHIKLDGLVQGFSYSPTLFAWYIDAVLIKNTTFIAYADNIVGAFANKELAFSSLELAKQLLNPTGLTIDDYSVTLVGSVSPHIMQADITKTSSLTFAWLGHGLLLPDCRVMYGQYEQKLIKAEPNIITLHDWKTMLKTQNWLNNVMKQEWRSVKQNY
nr:hypothetical protein [Volvulina compacta]